MATSTTATVDTKIAMGQSNGLSFPALSPSGAFQPAQQSYSSGTNAGQIDVPYMERITIASGSPQSLDLSGGAMKTLLNTAASFARVASLAFFNTGTNNVAITGNFMTSTFGASFSYTLKPKGRFVVDDPTSTAMPVTNSTADVITLTSAAGSNDVDVAIGGRSV